MGEDRSWMYLPRQLSEFENGVVEFLNASFSKASQGGQIRFSCKRCKNRYWHRRNEVFNHLKGNGFVDGYYVWNFHGEEPSLFKYTNNSLNDDLNMYDDCNDLLHDRFRDAFEGSCSNQGPNEDAKKFYDLVEEGKQELYPGCKIFSRLSFILRIFLFKTIHGLSNVAFDDLLQMIKEIIPEAKSPKDYYQARKIVRDLGFDYKKIYACPNHCMLYWKEDENLEECKVCHASKWKTCHEQENQDGGFVQKKSRIPAKVLWHFPLKPRLQRLFMCSETAKFMTWHFDGRVKDDKLRHPANGLAWEEFDSTYPSFAREHRNVRLGLASDGFNPFRSMSISHSTWPVVLVNYNLPPWMFMKPKYYMLSLLISGYDSPGKNIDVYLQPLIEELNDLWNDGVQTYDKFRDGTFQLHASLLWTISDFPGYSMLSGWKTKGKYACPSCNYETEGEYLHGSQKMCYMKNRRFLNPSHPWRRNKSSFNGKTEERLAPKPITGVEVLNDLSDIAGKSKDHAKARLDLLNMGIKDDLQPRLLNDGKHVLLPKACYSLTAEEKSTFCHIFKGAKLSCGCCSNIARCVNLKTMKVAGYKTHDARILLHYLLQVAARKTLPKHVAMPLIKLSAFFRKVNSKVVKCADLDSLQSELSIILCELEKIFLPCFFDIMTHLPIHLVEQIRLGGPVHGRIMYFIEMYFCKLKSYVRSRSHPEGSIAEGYLIKECLNLCSLYMGEEVKIRLKRYLQNMSDVEHEDEDEEDESENVFVNIGHLIGGKKRRKGHLFTLDAETSEQAHRYALFNSDSKDVDQYIKEHQVSMNGQRKRSRWARVQSHCHDFANWLKEKANNENIPDHIFWLVKGPAPTAKRYKGYYSNGYHFLTKSRDARCKTQNSGVTLKELTNSFASSKDHNPIADEVTYYGAILDIIEFDYWSKFKVVLFKCEWYHVEKDEYPLTCVNVEKLCYVNDPYVMASQVQQVFYVPDGDVHGLHYVMGKVPRDTYDFRDENEIDTNDDESPFVDEFNNHGDEEIGLAREDIFPNVVDANTSLGDVNVNNNQIEEDSDYDDALWDWMDANEDFELDNDE